METIYLSFAVGSLNDQMKKNVYLLFVFILFILPASAQCDHTLSGKVIDHHDRKPLEFAEVFVKELKRGALTDSSGNYKIQNLCPGNYTITCHHIGCDSLVMHVEINGNTTQNFYPEHHLHELGLINIVTDREPQKLIVNSVEIKQKELDKLRGETFGQTLRNLTGVNTIQTGSSISKPVIHGLHSSRILILNNGIRQEGQQWGSEHAPEIDPFVATKLTVIKVTWAEPARHLQRAAGKSAIAKNDVIVTLAVQLPVHAHPLPINAAAGLPVVAVLALGVGIDLIEVRVVGDYRDVVAVDQCIDPRIGEVLAQAVDQRRGADQIADVVATCHQYA